MITTTTTLEAFFASVVTRLQSNLSYAQSRVFVTDRLRLQSHSVPHIQIQPLSLTAVANNTGLNVCELTYKLWAVVRVEREIAKKQDERLVDARSAFFIANSAANHLRNWKPSTGATFQVFVSLEEGSYDDASKLGSASATFRTYIRLNDDG